MVSGAIKRALQAAGVMQSAEPEELDPVAEKPTEDTPVMDTKKGAKAPEK